MNIQATNFPKPSVRDYRDLKGRHQTVANEQRYIASRLLEIGHRLDTAAGLGNGDGRFGTKDLQACLGTCPEPIAWAASTALDRDYSYLKLDTASGRAPDAFVNAKDLEAARDNYGMSLEQAGEILQNNFPQLDDLARLAGRPDGLLGQADLHAAIFHPSTPTEVREASLAILGTEGAFETLESAAGLAPADGLVGMADLKAFAQGLKDGEPGYILACPSPA